MIILNSSHTNIVDLPDEILLIIINTLDAGEVFYSFVDINKRFTRLILDPLYIRNLNMTMMTIKSFYDRTFSIDDQVLSRICQNILPQIHEQVHRLTVEEDLIDRILIDDYPQLYSLSLVNMKEKKLFQYLKDPNSILYKILSKQITHLNIDIRDEKISSKLFPLILSVCKQLTDLNICQLFSYRNSSICISRPPPSSMLTKLKINLSTFDDCLYLLNGNLNHLSKLIINVNRIGLSLLKIKNRKKLPKLKSFSLTSLNHTFVYDKFIIPLFRRMINLEELTLFLSVIRRDSTFIDGIQLCDDILIHMPRLNKFVFSINTAVMLKKRMRDFSSNEDIQRSFIGRGYEQVGSYVFPNSIRPEYTYPMDPTSYIRGSGRCHVYSLPYPFKYFLHINNSFPGGMFDRVGCLTMNDLRSFEYQFFQLIARDFPCLKELVICNCAPQKNKQDPSTLIRFPHLILLNLIDAHVDYAEQFLFDKNIHLPCLSDLCISYELLTMVTNNFTNDATRFYCGKLKGLHIHKPFVRPKDFHSYFPLL